MTRAAQAATIALIIGSMAIGFSLGWIFGVPLWLKAQTDKAETERRAVFGQCMKRYPPSNDLRVPICAQYHYLVVGGLMTAEQATKLLEGRDGQ